MRPYETLIVDVTYRCNSPCAYCRWGTPKTDGRFDLPTAAVTLDDDSLRALNVRRVVLSGGEPLLHPDLDTILAHYRSRVPERIIITNGALLAPDRRRSLLAAGATGFTFSIDTVDSAVYAETRGWDDAVFTRVLRNLESAAFDRSFELGINAVVTSATARWSIVAGLFGLAALLRLDFVKFAPVFDDGFASANAPHLMLGPSQCDALVEIARSRAESALPFESNPPDFWNDLARLSDGEPLAGQACGLGSVASLAVRGELRRCFWVPESSLGPTSEVVTDARARRSLELLADAKGACKVGAHCFCLQPMQHVWKA